MKRRLKYIPPAVLEDLVLDLEAEILTGSNEVFDEDSSVETVGQEVVTIEADQWTNGWE